jgi:hypothetical protein
MKTILLSSFILFFVACSSSPDNGTDASTNDASNNSDVSTSDVATSDVSNEASTASFATSVYGPIISARCTFCHGLTADGGPGVGIQFGHLDMSTEANAYANLVGDGGGVPAGGSACKTLGQSGLLRVSPGSPASSLIYNKVVSNDGDGGSVVLADGGLEVFCGHPMPEFEPSIPSSDIATIHDWIAQGAQP